MLLKGATLLGEPCPYCKGVRVMKDGSAFCVNCGREAKEQKIPEDTERKDEAKVEGTTQDKLDQKLKDLADELSREKDHTKQKQIIRSINDIIALKEKLKNL